MTPEQKEQLVFDIARKYQLLTWSDVISIPPENPTEIIAEIEPTSKHQDFSVAMALLFQGENGQPSGSVEHFHPSGNELYGVKTGEVILYTRRSKTAEPERKVIRQGESATIEPHVLHRAEPVGEYAEVVVFSFPGWTPENHKSTDDFPEN